MIVIIMKCNFRTMPDHWDMFSLLFDQCGCEFYNEPELFIEKNMIYMCIVINKKIVVTS